MRILFATSTVFPYRADWLNELGKTADLDIFYLLDEDKDRNHDWMMKRPEKCRIKLMNGITFSKIGKISFDFIRHVENHGKEYDAIILDGYGFATQILNCLYLNRHHYIYFVNIDGMVENELENKVIYWFKRQIIKKFPFCFSGSKATNKLLNRYGVTSDRIINHPFTSLFNKDIYNEVCLLPEKEKLRKSLGITEQRVIISVGRFSYMGGYGKGYDVLIRAAKNMDRNIGWYVVGGKPTDEFVRMTEDAQLDNFHYVDFMKKETLKQYYRASDIFCLMTVSDVWGLVINEAMACGLPVITTNKCVAGADLVEEGVNGYIVDVGDDISLIKCIETIFSDYELETKMSRESLKKIGEYTIENMAEIHLQAINSIGRCIK